MLKRCIPASNSLLSCALTSHDSRITRAQVVRGVVSPTCDFCTSDASTIYWRRESRTKQFGRTERGAFALCDQIDIVTNSTESLVTWACCIFLRRFNVLGKRG